MKATEGWKVKYYWRLWHSSRMKEVEMELLMIRLLPRLIFVVCYGVSCPHLRHKRQTFTWVKITPADDLRLCPPSRRCFYFFVLKTGVPCGRCRCPFLKMCPSVVCTFVISSTHYFLPGHNTPVTLSLGFHVDTPSLCHLVPFIKGSPPFRRGLSTLP